MNKNSNSNTKSSSGTILAAENLLFLFVYLENVHLRSSRQENEKKMNFEQVFSFQFFIIFEQMC